MKLIQKIILVALLMCLISCLGDKKVVHVSDIGDSSFVNKSFKSNFINYSEYMSACERLSQNSIAKLYGVTSKMVHIEDPTKSDRYKNPTSGCMLYVKTGNSDFEWLRGSIEVKREINKDEFMGDVAEASGNGANWEEAWRLKKAISNSSEWIPNTGQAALWNPTKNSLEIKFEGYTLVIKPLKNILNKEEMNKNRNYKKIALDIAKNAGYIK